MTHQHRHIHIPALAAATILAATLGWMVVSCNTSGCLDNHSALPRMGFYDSATDKKVTIDSLMMWGVGAPDDSLLIKSPNKTQSLYVPFRFEKPSTSFCFHYDYKMQGLDDKRFNDTVTFHYTSTPHFDSAECGAFYIYHISRVDFTRHLIDSVEIGDSLITNVDMERIKIKFRISHDEAPAAAAPQSPGRGIRP